MLIPKNRHEYYLAVISGNDYPTFPPKIREEQYLAKLAGREVDVPTPRTPKERAYYNIINDIKFEPENRWQTFVAAANDDSITAPIPRTREEIWWSNISLSHEVIVEYVGTLPATLQTVEGYLESYKIYGNTEQAGTPTPENPIVPSGCGERTENLWQEDSTKKGYYNENGSFTKSGAYVSSKAVDIAGVSHIMQIINSFYSSGFYHQFAYFDENLDFISLYRVSQNGTGKKIISATPPNNAKYVISNTIAYSTNIMLTEGSTAPTSYIPYGYKLPLTVNGVEYPIYLGDAQLAKDEYVDSSTGKIYRRTKNLSPPEEEWVDEWIWGDGTVHPSAQIKTSPFIDVSTCETCIMEVFSTETEWAEAGYRAVAFYDANKQYLGWIGGGGRQALTPNSSERLSEFPAGTVYVRIGCSHGDQPFYPQLVSGYTPVHQFYPYRVPTDPPAPFPQIPTAPGETTISWAGEGLAPSEVELTYKTIKKTYISADDKVYQDPNGQLLGG